MKAQELHNNQSLLLKDIQMRDSVREFVESCELEHLRNLGKLFLNKDWNTRDLGRDLGSSAIESLLDELDYMDYPKLEGIYNILKSQSVVH